MLKSLSELLVGYARQTVPEIEVGGIRLDSRTVQKGDCFCALDGAKTSGREYIQDAIAKGASCILVDDTDDIKDLNDLQIGEVGKNLCPIIKVRELRQNLGKIASRFYDHPTHQMHIIGVTGTNGKTTISKTMAFCFNALSKPCASIGTLGFEFGDIEETTINTTPDAISLQAKLANLKNEGAKYACMEVTSHGLVQGRVNGIAYECAIFTNLTQDHLDYHQTMQNYGEAKKLLFKRAELQCIILNANDPFHYEIQKESNAQTCITYGIETSANVMATNVDISHNGMSATIQTPWGNGRLQTHLIGEFNLSNLLAVLSCLLYYQVPLKKALDVISQAKPVVGRMQTFSKDDWPLVIVDYAHTPDALLQTLKASRQHTFGKLWCVFGCGGDRDKTKRPLMGKIASENADYVVLTNDNPRTESPQAIVEDILSGNLKNQPHIILDRKEAIEYALSHANKNDVIVIAGKGHEDYQIIGQTTLKFSDMACVQNFAAVSKGFIHES